MHAPDVLVSERSRVSVVEELIRLSHYVMDLSTIVHLMHTSSHFHNNFEEDLDNVVDDLLPKINVKTDQGLKDSFKNDAYGEADKRSKETFKKFYFPVLQLSGKDTQNNKKAKKACMHAWFGTGAVYRVSTFRLSQNYLTFGMLVASLGVLLCLISLLSTLKSASVHKIFVNQEQPTIFLSVLSFSSISTLEHLNNCS